MFLKLIIWFSTLGLIDDIDVIIHGVHIERVYATQFLGVQID